MSSDHQPGLSVRDTRGRQERGAIILFVAVGLVVLIGMIGLAIDLGHAYVNKSQLQNIADASALAGASALNGTSAGIQEAENRATDYAGSAQYLANHTEFNTQPVAIPGANVTYSTALGGPWLDKGTAQGVASTIRFVQVVVPPQQTDVFFARVIPGISSVMNFGADAVAGQEPQTDVCQGLDPFSPAAIDLGDPMNFGYEAGEIFSIRLAPGSSGKNCSDYGLDGSVTGNFGLADPSGEGPNLTVFRDNLLYGDYRHCVPILSSDALDTTTGNMGNAALTAMGQRFDQDLNHDWYVGDPASVYSQYQSQYLSSTTNFRRIIKVAFNDGNIPQGNHEYTVVGYGCFFMPVRPDAEPPSAAICLMYVGACGQSGAPSGGNQASITKIVLFR